MDTVKLLPSVVPTCRLLEVMSKTIKMKDIMLSMQTCSSSIFVKFMVEEGHHWISDLYCHGFAFFLFI